MFSVEQKRDISAAVQRVLRGTNHPELPTTGEVSFLLHVDGAESWSFADIKNNAAVGDPGVNPHNEAMASMPEQEARELIKHAEEFTGQVPYTPDPRNTPDDFMREMLTNDILTLKEGSASLRERLDKLEEALSKDSGTADSDINPLVSPMEQLRRVVTKLRQMEDKDKIHRKLYSELRFGLDKLQDFLTPIMEDNLIPNHDERLRTLEAALEHLNNERVKKTIGDA
jgi:hypothetical protein